MQRALLHANPKNKQKKLRFFELKGFILSELVSVKCLGAR